MIMSLLKCVIYLLLLTLCIQPLFAELKPFLNSDDIQKIEGLMNEKRRMTNAADSSASDSLHRLADQYGSKPAQAVRNGGSASSGQGN